MKKILALLALLITTPCLAQQITTAGPNAPCTAFGTTSGTCIQGAGAGGTPSSITLTNGTGLPRAGISDFGTNVGAALGNTLNASGGVLGVTATAGTAWTPVLACTTGSVSTYSVQVGYYNLVGNSVTAHWYMVITNMGTCSGVVTITGLGLTPNSTTNWRGDGAFTNIVGVAAGATYTSIIPLSLPGSSTIFPTAIGTGVAAVTPASLTAAMLTTPQLEGFINFSL